MAKRRIPRLSAPARRRAGNPRFDPAEFLETAAKGRIVSTHAKRIFLKAMCLRYAKAARSPSQEETSLLLANFGKEGRPEPIIAKISQETLAEMIGTTRSRVSHFMNKFRGLGFITYNGHLEVHSSLLSVVLNEQPNTVL